MVCFSCTLLVWRVFFCHCRSVSLSFFLVILECTTVHLRPQSEMTQSSGLLAAIIIWMLKNASHLYAIDVWSLLALLVPLEYSQTLAFSSAACQNVVRVMRPWLALYDQSFILWRSDLSSCYWTWLKWVLSVNNMLQPTCYSHFCLCLFKATISSTDCTFYDTSIPIARF